MNDIKEKKKQYTFGACLFFAVFGFGCLIGFILELYSLATTDRRLTLFALVSLGFLSYVFIYAAYKGKAPSWYEDKSIFGSNKK